MSQSFTNLLYHLIFSTKERWPIITLDYKPRYVARQEEHHKRVSFREEFIQFLKANGIEYNERYL